MVAFTGTACTLTASATAATGIRPVGADASAAIDTRACAAAGTAATAFCGDGSAVTAMPASTVAAVVSPWGTTGLPGASHVAGLISALQGMGTATSAGSATNSSELSVSAGTSVGMGSPSDGRI